MKAQGIRRVRRKATETSTRGLCALGRASHSSFTSVNASSWHAKLRRVWPSFFSGLNCHDNSQ